MTWPPAPPPAPPPEPSLPPPGWYPDPSGQAAHRWWDGSRWTDHLGTPPQAIARPQIPLASGPAELAGWWRRLGGYLLDIVIIDVAQFIVTLAIGLTQRNNVIPGTTTWHYDPVAQVAVVVISVLILLLYPYLLLRFNGQTVGMMAAGVRAVDRTSGAPLTPPQAARRVLTYFVVVALWAQIATLIAFRHVYGPVPLAETLFRLVTVAGLATTSLWVLGSPLNQTLQDKAADTVVVRTRARHP